jgi:hypothetical protein
MMNEMGERAAKALIDARAVGEDFVWFDGLALPPPSTEDMTKWVMIVIAAMREPTGAMIQAAEAVDVHGADLHDFVAHQCAAPVWQAMIDAALKD